MILTVVEAIERHAPRGVLPEDVYPFRSRHPAVRAGREVVLPIEGGCLGLVCRVEELLRLGVGDAKELGTRQHPGGPESETLAFESLVGVLRSGFAAGSEGVRARDGQAREDAQQCQAMSREMNCLRCYFVE